MATVGNKNLAKTSNVFVCDICDYNTERKGNYDNHLLTAKHKMATDGNICQQISSNIFECEKCKKVYKDRTGLWKHKKKCIHKDPLVSDPLKPYDQIDDVTDKDLIIMLMKKNDELQNMMMEVIKNGIGNNSHNTTTTTTHTNSHNKAFNLNFFLNETCKDAMNIGEFVDSLKLQLSDLEKVGEAGYIEGITSIIVKNLKALDVTKRPVHCTDKKRETVYIKDEDKWEKDEDKSKMHKLVKKVVTQNVKMFAKFREAHPDCKQYHSKYSDQYNKIIYESMGGKGDDDFEKNERIIKNVLKEVVIDKTI
jgi:hypothetical protein